MKHREVTMNKDLFLKKLKIKKFDSYKNINGRALIFGGSYGYHGSVIMNIKACLKTNVGYVTGVVDDSIYPIVASNIIEAIFSTNSNYDILKLLDNNDAVLFGSGMVNMDIKKQIFDEIIQYSKIPYILDGEAFNLLKSNMYLLKFSKAKIILTPHLGEFSRIMDIDVSELKRDKLKYAKKFINEFPNITLVLKDHETIVIDADRIYYNKVGNQVLAKAGSGDVLAGLMIGYLSQGITPFDSAVMACFLHGSLADISIINNDPSTIQPLDILKSLDIFFKI